MQGGTNANPKDFPYVVQVDQDKICAGTIIDPHWVVTAAHCTEDDEGNQKEVKVIAGTIWAEASRFKGDNMREYYPDNVILHPDYNMDKKVKQNRIYFDIALLYFKEEIDFRFEEVDSMELPQSLGLAINKCTVMGWGCTRIKYEDDKNKRKHVDMCDRLKYAEMQISGWSSPKESSLSFGSKKYESKLIFNYVKNRGPRPLKGDSGGPLICWDLNKRKVLYGVLQGMNYSGFIRYTSVYHHLEWIQEKMKQQKQQDEDEKREKGTEINFFVEEDHRWEYQGWEYL